MSAKGLDFPMFCSTMDLPMFYSTTTAYVLCGLAVIVFWNLSKYMVKSAGSGRPAAPKSEERNGGTVSGVSSADAAEDRGAEDAKSNCLGNGIPGRTKWEQTDDQDDFVEMWSSTIQGCELSGPTLEKSPGPTEVDGCGRRVVRETGWKGEGPHVVHLLENGWTEEDLDTLQCPIEVYAWFAHRQSCGCSCELEVILEDKGRRRIAEYQYDPESCKPTADIFKKVSLIFENYGAGVRYVTYSHRRRKFMDKECKVHCGCEMYSGLRKLLKINNLK